LFYKLAKAGPTYSMKELPGGKVDMLCLEPGLVDSALLMEKAVTFILKAAAATQVELFISVVAM
jgi:hypothetical protein